MEISMLQGLFNGAKTKVVFLHLPKTAGTSFVNFLNDQYKPAEIVLKYNEELSSQDFIGRHKVLVGHLPWNQIHVDVVDYQVDGWKFISFLRDPVERSISSYLAVKYSESQEHCEKFKSWENSFEGFLNAPHSYNWQCQFFSGLKLNPMAFTNPEMLLEKAVANISIMDFVGRTENFNEDLKYLCETYNWAYSGNYMKNVRGMKKEAQQLRSKYGQSLQLRCELDYKLLEVVAEKFGR